MERKPLFSQTAAPTLIQSDAPVRELCEINVPFTSGVIGEARVILYKATDDADRGGILVRMSIRPGDGPPHLPTAVNLEDDGGVELHLSGQAEAEALLTALIAGAQRALIALGTR